MNALRQLFKNGEVRNFPKKEMIRTPNEKDEYIYYIEQGYIMAYEPSLNDEKKILLMLEPGNIFPLISSPHEVTSEVYLAAYTDVTLFALKRTVFNEKTNANKKLLQEIIQALSAYLLIYVDRVHNLELHLVSQKVAQRILSLHNRFSDTNGRIKIPLTHEFIASSINVARENVTRELAYLKRKKIIEVDKSQITVLNPRLLQELTEKGRS